MDQSTIILLSPFVVGLVELAKKSGMPTEYSGPAALVYSFALTALVVEDPTSREAAMTAIATGLAAAGLYSQGKVVAEVVATEEQSANGPSH